MGPEPIVLKWSAMGAENKDENKWVSGGDEPAGATRIASDTVDGRHPSPPVLYEIL